MTTRLGKTAQQLLQRLRDRGHVTVSWYYGQGPDGGRLNYGAREVNAANALIRAGLARRVRVDKTAFPKNGYTAWTTDILIELVAS